MRCGTASLPDGSWAAGKVTDPNAVGHVIKQLHARLEISQTRAHVAVSDVAGSFRVLDLDGKATEQEVAGAVSRELQLDPQRFATGWVDVGSTDDRRTIYAAAWDRATVKTVTDAVMLAGLDPTVVELKSAAVVRTVPEASCLLIDLVANPAEIVLIDRNVPQIWHGFELTAATPDGLPEALAPQVHSVVRFYRRKRDVAFGHESPVLISSEQTLPAQVLNDLADLIGHPARELQAPPRVPANVRHATYLTCLGLIMRRDM